MSATIPAGMLKTGSTYYYRVLAENATGTTEGTIQPFTTLPAVQIDSESVAEVTATSATVQAEINPFGSETSYYIQYGTTSCTTSPADCTSVPAPPGEGIGSAETDQAASVHIQGLQSDTTYHYRVIATNLLGTIEGPDQTFTTQATGAPFALPDGRQYELVSPPDKHGTEVRGIHGYSAGGVVQASEDGGKITYVTFEPPELDAPANGPGTQLLSSRGSEGWSTQNIALPNSAPVGVPVGTGSQYKAFSPDLMVGLAWNGFGGRGFGRPVEEAPLPGSGAPAGYQNYYLTNNEDGAVDALLQLPLPATLEESPSSFGMELVAASPDLEHLVIRTEAALTPGMSNNSGWNLYEWTAGHFEPIDLLPSGSPDPGAGTDVGSGRAGTSPPISTDGSSVVWTEGKQLYVRENIGTPQAKTVLVPTTLTFGGIEFKVESNDGSRVFYTERNAKDGVTNYALAVFDTLADQSTLIAEGVQGVVGESKDGSYLYYVANDRLFLWHEGESPRFIATLSGGDEESGNIKNVELGVAADWSRILGYRTARVSPDGKRLVFMSENSLTGYDNTVSSGSSCVSIEGNPGPARCEEVFLYDASSGHLTCVSCNPTGGRPTGPSGIPGGTPFETNKAFYDSRVLSDNGRRVFFESADALVPNDTNGVGDVYEWEEDGEGTCAHEGGCVSLISSGQGSTGSSFLDASETGTMCSFSRATNS